MKSLLPCLFYAGSILASPALCAADPTTLPLKDARLKIELNATDGDAGIQVFVDGEPWSRLIIQDINGRTIFHTVTRGRFELQGGTELFLESAEPDFSELPLKEFLRRFPAGRYTITTYGLDGERYEGRAMLTHNLPAGPTLRAPLENHAPVNPDEVELEWSRVPAPNGSPIVGYQVIVALSPSGIPAIPKVVLDITLPPTATELEVPEGFLKPGTRYEWEVLAVEASGNQTLSTSFFTTASSP